MGRGQDAGRAALPTAVGPAAPDIELDVSDVRAMVPAEQLGATLWRVRNFYDGDESPSIWVCATREAALASCARNICEYLEASISDPEMAQRLLRLVSERRYEEAVDLWSEATQYSDGFEIEPVRVVTA